MTHGATCPADMAEPHGAARGAGMGSVAPLESGVGSRTGGWKRGRDDVFPAIRPLKLHPCFQVLGGMRRGLQAAAPGRVGRQALTFGNGTCQG